MALRRDPVRLFDGQVLNCRATAPAESQSKLTAHSVSISSCDHLAKRRASVARHLWSDPYQRPQLELAQARRVRRASGTMDPQTRDEVLPRREWDDLLNVGHPNVRDQDGVTNK